MLEVQSLNYWATRESCATVLNVGAIGTGSKEVTENEGDRDHRGLSIAERRWVFA